MLLLVKIFQEIMEHMQMWYMYVIILLALTGCEDQFLFWVSLLCVYYYYFSKYSCWINLFIYMIEKSATQVYADMHGTWTFRICMWKNWVFSQCLSYWTYSFFTSIWLCIIFIALEAVIEYSQNTEEVSVKKLTLGEDKLYLRVGCYFK